ncbi:MAG: hypothetical protein P8X60_10455 [Robiginitalea sp.]|jgi:hypothetical protein
MKRRNFVILSGIGVAALSLPAACSQFQVPAYDPLIAEPELLSFIWDTETMIEMGALYRDLTPEEDTEDELLQMLLGDPPEQTDDPVQVVNDRVESDYETSDIVMLEGWMLSRTEARQCALLSIIQTA